MNRVAGTTGPTSGFRTLRCMEIWGGNESIDSAVTVPGIDLWISSQPYGKAAQGGDIYYLSSCACGSIFRVLLADVSGHGESVAYLAGRLRRLMRRYINTANQAKLAQALNRDMRSLAKHGQFATAVMLAYFPPTNQLIVCNAGHPEPLWYQAASNRWQLLCAEVSRPESAPWNIPLGVVEGTSYQQFVVTLEKNDLLVVYSDALIEATNPASRELGRKGLLEVLRRLSGERPPTLLEDVRRAVDEYRGSTPPEDDETIMVLHHTATDPPRQTLGSRLRAAARMMGLLRN